MNYSNDVHAVQEADSNGKHTGLKVKVCGMTCVDQVLQLDAMGIDFAGFIFYPQSPRYVLNKLKANDLKNINGRIKKTGVFVNASEAEILKTVEDCGLHQVQLHGDESPRFCEMIANFIPVVKAFRVNEDDAIEWKIKDYVDVVDMLLFDTHGHSYGGTGKKFNWELLKGLNIPKPYYLSGGINPDDVSNLKEFQYEAVAKDLFAVDINSRFETEPGVKDMKLVESFFNNLKG